MVLQYESHWQSNRTVVALACKLANTLAVLPNFQHYFLCTKYCFYRLCYFVFKEADVEVSSAWCETNAAASQMKLAHFITLVLLWCPLGLGSLTKVCKCSVQSSILPDSWLLTIDWGQMPRRLWLTEHASLACHCQCWKRSAETTPQSSASSRSYTVVKNQQMNPL